MEPLGKAVESEILGRAPGQVQDAASAFGTGFG